MVSTKLPIGFFALCFAVAKASTVNILPNQNGITQVVASITSDVTDGSTMVGMTVTVNFSVGASQTVAWASTGATSGRATGAITGGNWMLAVNGDTGNLTAPGGTPTTAWTLTNSSTSVAITSIILDGAPTNTVFDRDRNNIGTPTSNFGIDYAFGGTEVGKDPFTVNVTYSNIVALAGPNQGCSGLPSNNTVTGCGDLWRTLTFAFSPNLFVKQNGNGHPSASWTFFQDTDTVAGVPEPLTIGLTGTGLLAIAAYGRPIKHNLKDTSCCTVLHSS